MTVCLATSLAGASLRLKPLVKVTMAGQGILERRVFLVMPAMSKTESSKITIPLSKELELLHQRLLLVLYLAPVTS